ncbi:MAG: hypothetical protein H7Y00_09945, partial [Fimbriimonadaceae bacterium]|nr:hypothetical protein [Chitinophagales bacterium]
NLDTAAYKKEIFDLQKKLESNYDVRFYTLGENLKENNTITFSEKITDISSALEDIQNIYQNLNVGAIVFASDGIYNSGSNPVYVKNNLNAPYYTIALGDTVPKKDIRISRVQHNNIVYLRDKFSVRCDVDAIFCTGNNSKITISEISKNGNVLRGEKSISVPADQFSTNAEFILEADAPGIRHYRVAVQKIEGEFTTDNNVQDIYIEVLDARQKILILVNAPHPDIAALKQSIETNQNYEVTVALPNTLQGNIAEQNLIILHNLPSAINKIENVLNVIDQQNIPVWFIVGDQTATNTFNKLQNIVQVNPTGPAANQVTATNELSFNLFTISQPSLSSYPKFPPLAAPYGKYTISAASQVLFYQKIGTVGTKYPLLIYSIPGTEKRAVLCGENFYKWRMYDYVLNNNQSATNELVSKTIQYLSAKNDKKQFRAIIANAQNVINENESIIIDAELYNDSYELINIPEANLTITDDNGKEFTYQFTKTGNRYTLNAGYFSEGSYSFVASTTLNGKQFTDKGAFSIASLRLESINSTADHKILNQMSVESNGKMVYPDEIASIESLIKNTASAKPVLHEIVKTRSLINLKWLFFLLLGLLTIEWFTRKYSGAY